MPYSLPPLPFHYHVFIQIYLIWKINRTIHSRSVYHVKDIQEFAVQVPVQGPDGIITHPKFGAPKSFSLPYLDGPENVQIPFGDVLDPNALTSGLLKWCDAISGLYGLHVHNFTTCLADGRALCLLIHYYHPTILPVRIIQATTASILSDHYKRHKEANSELEQFTEASLLSGAVLSKCDVKKGLEGERKNFHTIKAACHAIGGTYYAIRSSSFSHKKTLF